MTEAVAFPDVEALAVTYLTGRLSGVPVSTRVPHPRPAKFVRVSRVGGTSPNRVTDAALVIVKCWAATEPEAADLARTVRAYVGAMAQTSVGSDYVRRIREVAGPQAFPDPASESPRYQFTVQIDTRGVAL